MHGTLLVCKGSQEGPAYIIHAVHAHGRALEDAAAGEGVSGAKGSSGARAALPTASHTSPGCGEDSIEQRGPTISRGQQEHVLCGEGTTLGEGEDPGSRVYGPAFTPPHPILHSCCLRSWSKFVSPSAPGTEQTSRAFRNVVHLLTRLRWPPTSFCRGQQEGIRVRPRHAKGLWQNP